MQIAYQTNSGPQRTDNQDAVGFFYNEANLPLMMIADGVASNPGSQQASQIVIEFLGDAWRRSNFTGFDEIHSWLLVYVDLANQEVIKAARENPANAQMATTLVLAVIMGRDLLVANAGDSKAFLVQNQQFQQISFDHNLRNELSRKSGGKYGQSLPEGDSLTRYLGVNNQADLEFYHSRLLPGSVLFLTSDGLPKVLSHHQLSEMILAPQPVTQRVKTIIEAAIKLDASDNITAIIAADEQS